MYNKLQKQAYFVKRLRDSGYNVERVFAGYSFSDPRMWTIVINPKEASLHCTCYANNGDTDGINPDSTAYFEVYDGGQFFPGRMKIDTSSFEVFTALLIKRGVQPMSSKPRVYQEEED